MDETEGDSASPAEPSESRESTAPGSLFANVPTIASPDPEPEEDPDCETAARDDEVFVDTFDHDYASKYEEDVPCEAVRPNVAREGASSKLRRVDVVDEESPREAPSGASQEPSKLRLPEETCRATSPRKRSSGADVSPRKLKSIDLHGILKARSPYEWGVVLSNAYQQMYNELLFISPESTLQDAKIHRAQGDAETDALLKVKSYIQSITFYSFVGYHYERNLEKAREALYFYEIANDIAGSSLEILRMLAQDFLVERYVILSLKIKAWLSYCMFTSQATRTKRAGLKENADRFIAIALSLEDINPPARPTQIEVPSTVLMDVAKVQDQNHILLTAVKCWNEADEMLENNKDHESFFSASESAVDRTIDVTSAIEFFVKFVRETLCRIALFTDEPQLVVP